MKTQKTNKRVLTFAGSELLHRTSILAGAMLCGLFPVASARAANMTWDGGKDTSWTTKQNWTPQAVPSANDSLIFAGTTRTSNTNNFAAGTSFSGISFSSTAGAFVLAGNALSLGGDIVNNSTNAQTISLAMALTGTRAFNAASGNLAVSGLISGASFGITKTGSQTLTLSGANTYGGGTGVSAGTLALAGSGTLGTGSLTVSGGTVNLGGKSLTNTLGALTGGGALSNGSLTNNGGSYDLRSGTVGVVLAGSNALSKTTSGSVTLDAANTYTGLTTISAGTLVLGTNGSIAGSLGVNLGTSGSPGTLDVSSKASFAFGAAQTVSGSGTINIGEGKTVTVAFTPGNSAGEIQVIGNLALAGATTMELAGSGGVAGADFDHTVVTGALNYDGSLAVVSLGGFDLFTAGTYDLFDFASGFTGNFASVSFGGDALSYNTGLWSGSNNDFEYSFALETGNLSVVAVPEPSTWVLLAISLTIAVTFRRRAGSCWMRIRP